MARKALLLAGGSWRLVSKEQSMDSLVFFLPLGVIKSQAGRNGLLSRGGPRSGDRQSNIHSLTGKQVNWELTARIVFI